MTTELTTQPKASALAVMAERYNVEPNKLLDTLKHTVFKGATNDELVALVVVANAYGLNPLTKELYAFPAKGGGIVPVVSVDGWIRMVNDHPQCDGIEFEQHIEAGKLVAVTCKIYRKDRSHPTVVTEYLAECKRNTEPWKMENRMLRHKALIQCARVAFGFSGITDEDEAAQTAGLARDVTPKAARAEPIDPFAGVPQPEPSPTIEAEIVPEEKLEDDALLMDVIDSINECADMPSLSGCVKQATDTFTDAKLEMVKRAIAARAKQLGVKWSKDKEAFV